MKLCGNCSNEHKLIECPYMTGLVLKKDYRELLEKAEKWDKLIESFTFDFQPIDNIPEVARQFIENEVRTTHKLYEENKQLKEIVDRAKKQLNEMDIFRKAKQAGTTDWLIAESIFHTLEFVLNETKEGNGQ